MEIPLSPDLETKLKRIAAETGRAASEVVKDLIARHLDHDEWFRSEVRKGIDELDRGEFVSDEEVRKRIERTLRS